MAKANPFAGKKAAPFGGGPTKGKPPAFLKKSAAAPAFGRKPPAAEEAAEGEMFRRGGKVKRK